MKELFINLKRFDIPTIYGGICPLEDPSIWIDDIIKETAHLCNSYAQSVSITYLLPESLLITATSAVKKYKAQVSLGSQGVHWQDVSVGGNFGAFTTSLPASAARTSGASWAIIGHSEERKALMHLLSYTNPSTERDQVDKVTQSVNEILNAEVLRALDRELHILYCVGETAEEQGSGSNEEKIENLRNVLTKQLQVGLGDFKKYRGQQQIVIGYEPIWSIGPGKTPADKKYVEVATHIIKEIGSQLGIENLKVIYGGGLKAANARELGSIPELDGGLVALTQFTPPIGFSVKDLYEIMRMFLQEEM